MIAAPLALWGFAGQYEGNFDAIEAFFPILELQHGDTRSFFVARSDRWNMEYDLLPVRDELSLSAYGTRLESDEPIHVGLGDVVIMVGPAFLTVAQELITLSTDEWLKQPNGFYFCIAPRTLLRDLTSLLDAPLAQAFWGELSRAQDDIQSSTEHLDRATRLLRVVAASPTFDRAQYYAAALAFAQVGPRSGIDKEAQVRRVQRLARLELGPRATEFPEIAERFSRGSRPIYERSDVEQTDYRITLDDLRRATPTEGIAENLQGFAEWCTERIVQASQMGDPLLVDLSLGSTNSPDLSSHALRLDTTKLITLSNLLNGHFRNNKSIVIRPPDVSAVANQVARSGLMTRIALDGQPGDPLPQLWTSPWHPGNAFGRQQARAGTSLQVSRKDFGIPVHRNLLSFVNPHHRVWTDELTIEVSRSVEAFLTSRLSALTRRPRPSFLNALIGIGVNVVIQLLSNVRNHAELSRGPLSLASEGDFSVVQLFTTRGGGTRSGNRLYISVSDTGIGIPSSVCKRHPATKGMNAEQVLRATLDGEFRSESGSVGFGLSEILRVAQEFDNDEGGDLAVSPRMLLATSGLDVGKAIVCIAGAGVARSSHGDRLVFSEWKAPLAGTTALVTLPLKSFGAPPEDEATGSASQLAFQLGID